MSVCYSFSNLKEMWFVVVFFLSFFHWSEKKKNKNLQLSKICLNWLLSNMKHNFIFKYLSVFFDTL